MPSQNAMNFNNNVSWNFLLKSLFTLIFFPKDSKTLAAKEKEVKKITDGLHSLQEASHKDAEALAAAQQHFNAVSAGLSSNEDGAEATLAGQMITCKNDISKAQTEAKQVCTDSKHGVGTTAVREKQLFTLCFALLQNLENN